MGNHCAECEICGDCLRGCGQVGACGWRDCPGYIASAEDLLKIAAMHPLEVHRAKATEIFALVMRAESSEVTRDPLASGGR
jgi:hypothetical protein